MGRWAMYRRRGTSPSPAGILILDFLDTGDGENFRITFSQPVDDSGGFSQADLVVGGSIVDSLVTNGDVADIVLSSPVVGPVAWFLDGAFFAASPLLFPQSGMTHL